MTLMLAKHASSLIAGTMAAKNKSARILKQRHLHDKQTLNISVTLKPKTKIAKKPPVSCLKNCNLANV